MIVCRCQHVNSLKFNPIRYLSDEASTPWCGRHPV